MGRKRDFYHTGLDVSRSECFNARNHNMALYGNVYHVCQAANTNVYSALLERFDDQRYTNDDSLILHTDIQSALDATVANREDYVYVHTDGSDYDLTASLTMSKKGVHLLAPGGLSHGGGIPGNAVRLHQTTAGLACMTSTADCIEMAGFFCKGMIDSPIVDLSGTRWHNYIHHNFLGGAVTAGAAIYTITGAGAVFQCTISDNYIMGGYSPNAAQTISGLIGFTSGSSGRNLIARNYLVTGARITVTAGVVTGGTNDMVVDNIFHETVATVLTAGTFTEAWNGSTTTVYIGNKVAMDTPAESGGTVNNTHVDNWSATAGSTILEAS